MLNLLPRACSHTLSWIIHQFFSFSYLCINSIIQAAITFLVAQYQNHHWAALFPVTHAHVMSSALSSTQETAPTHNTSISKWLRTRSTTLHFCQFLRDVTDTINSPTILPVLTAHHIFYSHLMPLPDKIFLFLTLYSVQSKWGATDISTTSHSSLKGLFFKMRLHWQRKWQISLKNQKETKLLPVFLTPPQTFSFP